MIEPKEINAEMIHRDLSELRKDVYGNGTPGLKTEVLKIKLMMKQNTWLTGIIAMTMISGLVKLIFFM